MIAETLGCHKQTVGRVLAQHATLKKPSEKTSRSPPLIDTAGCEHLETLATNGKRQFATKTLCKAWKEKTKVSLCADTSIFPCKNEIFQQDDAPVHTARVAQGVLVGAKVKTLPRPATSPDLNPIENLWPVMEKNLYKRTPPPSNVAQLNRMFSEGMGRASRKFIAQFGELFAS